MNQLCGTAQKQGQKVKKSRCPQDAYRHHQANQRRHNLNHCLKSVLCPPHKIVVHGTPGHNSIRYNVKDKKRNEQIRKIEYHTNHCLHCQNLLLFSSILCRRKEKYVSAAIVLCSPLSIHHLAVKNCHCSAHHSCSNGRPYNGCRIYAPVLAAVCNNINRDELKG